MASEKTPVMILQELLIQKYQMFPQYSTTGEGTQPSSDRFEVTVVCKDITASGRASSKKLAKQECARNALVKLGYKLATTTKSKDSLGDNEAGCCKRSMQNFINYVGLLNEFTSQKRYGNPLYNFSVNMETGGFIATCEIAGVKTEGNGIDKKCAKQEAARLMLDQFKEKFPHTFTTTKNKKIPFAPKDVDKIIGKFKDLSMLTNCFSDKEIAYGNTDIVKHNPSIKESDSNDSEKLSKNLQELGIEYRLITMQTSPYIICMVIKNSPLTHLGYGNSEESACCDAFRQAIFIAKQGCMIHLNGSA